MGDMGVSVYQNMPVSRNELQGGCDMQQQNRPENIPLILSSHGSISTDELAVLVPRLVVAIRYV